MKVERRLLTISVAIALLGGCTGTPTKQNAVRDAATAIRIGLDACVSKKVVQPSLSDMHAELRNGSWHVWEQGGKCEVFSTDVDAVTGAAGPCSVCVT
jgi:hypothetical protein